jgi:glucokinase
MRFKKDIARAAVSDKEIIVVEGMQRVLTNIGAEHRLSPDEMKTIFQELGNATGEIPMQRMLQIL